MLLYLFLYLYKNKTVNGNKISYLAIAKLNLESITIKNCNFHATYDS